VFDPGSDRRSCSQFRPDESAASDVIGPVVEPRVGSIERRLEPPRPRNGDCASPGPVDSGFEIVYARAVKASTM
jgi:hypothetical protein